MKKVILSATALSVALVGCATHTTTKEAATTPNHSQYDISAPHHKNVKGAKKGEYPHLYVCEQNTKIAAKYDHKKDFVELNVTAPSLGLNAQEVQLKLAVSGSGERYLNDKNPASIYEWHIKGGEGALTITANGKEYNYVCQAKHSHP